MTDAPVRPPFDPELEPAVAGLAEAPDLTPQTISVMRRPPAIEALDALLAERGITRRDVTVPGHSGDEIVVMVLSRDDHSGAGPGLYYMHGGGMISGDRFSGVDRLVDWVARHDAVAVSVQYRIAPEFPDPYPLEDCYAGLVWMAEHAAEIGVDAARIVLVGGSAGGGLAAGTALLARDRKGPGLLGQLLMSPMLDDRDETVSARQMEGIPGWSRAANVVGWTALLGERRGTGDVSLYAAPARATDLAGLPPTFIDLGSVEVFRDEGIAYANALWAAGVAAELHVWAGGFHRFTAVAAQTAISRGAEAARDNWVERLLRS